MNQAFEVLEFVPMCCRKKGNSEQASNRQNAKRPEVLWDGEPSSEADDIMQVCNFELNFLSCVP
jgi:hypothetical protein